jgi:hypothetical protein
MVFERTLRFVPTINQGPDDGFSADTSWWSEAAGSVVENLVDGMVRTPAHFVLHPSALVTTSILGRGVQSTVVRGTLRTSVNGAEATVPCAVKVRTRPASTRSSHASVMRLTSAPPIPLGAGANHSPGAALAA